MFIFNHTSTIIIIIIIIIAMIGSIITTWVATQVDLTLVACECVGENLLPGPLVVPGGLHLPHVVVQGSDGILLTLLLEGEGVEEPPHCLVRCRLSYHLLGHRCLGINYRLLRHVLLEKLEDCLII